MNRQTKTYILDGVSYQFDESVFGELFKRYKKTHENTILETEVELGEALGVSASTVHSWRFGSNGPMDLELVAKLSEFLNVNDFHVLLRREETEMKQITERQRDSLLKVYYAIFDYLELFNETNGFNDLWFHFCREGCKPENVEHKLYEFAEEAQNKVEKALRREYAVLHKLEVYGVLEEYVNDCLSDIYNEKLSYAYRFEAPVEKIDGTQSGVTTEEDYLLAWKRMNEILEPYI